MLNKQFEVMEDTKNASRMMRWQAIAGSMIMEEKMMNGGLSTSFETAPIPRSIAQGESRLVRGLASAEATAVKTVTNTVTRSESVLGHIFRDAVGHVNPSTVASQNRYIRLFENVANNSANLNPNVLTNFQRTAGGFQGYSQIFKNGQQVWTQTLNGKIINAGVNIIPK